MVLWIGRPIGTVGATWPGSVMTWQRGEGGVLGRAVAVDQRPAAAGRQHGAYRVRVERVAAGQELTGTPAMASISASASWWNRPAVSHDDRHLGGAQQRRDLRQPERAGRRDHERRRRSAARPRAPTWTRRTRPGRGAGSRSPGPSGANVGSRDEPDHARCGTATPFGTPVEPEVKLM